MIPYLARDVSRIETPLFPVVFVQYSRCKSNSPKSFRFVYSHDCVSTQPRNSCGVLSGPPGTNCLRRSLIRWPSTVPSAITVHWPSPMTSQPSRFFPLNSGLASAACNGPLSTAAQSNPHRFTVFTRMLSHHLLRPIHDHRPALHDPAHLLYGDLD